MIINWRFNAIFMFNQLVILSQWLPWLCSTDHSSQRLKIHILLLLGGIYYFPSQGPPKLCRNYNQYNYNICVCACVCVYGVCVYNHIPCLKEFTLLLIKIIELLWNVKSYTCLRYKKYIFLIILNNLANIM